MPGTTITISEPFCRPSPSIPPSFCEGRAGQVVKNDAEADTVIDDRSNTRVSFDAFAYFLVVMPRICRAAETVSITFP